MLFLVEDLWVLLHLVVEEKEKKASSRGTVSGWALLLFPSPYPSRALAPPRRPDWTAVAADASMSVSAWTWTWASRPYPCPRQEWLEEVRGVCWSERVCGRERGRVET